MSTQYHTKSMLQGAEEHPNPGQRRQGNLPRTRSENRFGTCYDGLSPETRRFAEAFEQYRDETHRQMLSYNEIMFVIKSLGYRLVD